VKKVAFLVPQNKKCGVRDYSETLLGHIERVGAGKFSLEKIEFRKTNNPFYYIKLARTLSCFDIVHMQHEFGLFGLFGLNFVPFALACPKKLVVTFHEFHEHSRLILLKERLIMAFSAPKVFAAIVLSRETEKNARIFFPEKKITNTGFGVELKAGISFEKNPKRVVVHPGFIRLNKNQLFTLRLARLLPEMEFVIAGGGEGSYFEEVSAEAKKLKNVKVTDFLDEKDYCALIKGAGLVILPYTVVAQSAAFYDALSLGKPVLSSSLGFFKDMEREGACITERLDEVLFVARIKKFFSDERERKRRFSSANVFLASNAMSSVAARNARIYEEAFLHV